MREVLILLFSITTSLEGHVLLSGSEDNPCAARSNGKYSIPDVFGYLQCIDHKPYYESCSDTDVFDIKQKKCVAPSALSKKTFCNNRALGNYRDPWDCHKYITCVGTDFYERPCQSKEFVYDPYSDSCGRPETLYCQQIESDYIMVEPKDNLCDKRDDGKYSIPDVFSYLECKNHKGKYISCSGTNVFDKKQKECVAASTLSKKTFCNNRAIGNYRDPWDCHKFITCVSNYLYERPCQSKEFVYDPYSDSCETPDKFTCKQIEKEFSDQVENPCKNKKDGTYAIPDVFRYLVCKKGVPSYESCPANAIYDPQVKECVDRSKVSLPAFCKYRDDGDWSNPLNCQRYIECKDKVMKNRACLINGFVYQPYKDVCVRPSDYPCYQLQEKLSCVDGNYSNPDMFSYLNCKDDKLTVVECPKNFIFNSSLKHCVNGSSLSIKTFCNNKKDGDYQNLWDCHSFIACVHEKYHSRPCPENLVYDPYSQRCEYQAAFRCRQLGDGECDGKKDGSYSTPDLFKYMKCTSGQSEYKNCPENSVFNEMKQVCIDGSYMKKSEFCHDKKDGDYQDPWDCHSYLSCVHGRTIERPCALEFLVYNPFSNKCQFFTEYQCKQLSETKIVLEKKEKDNEVAIGDICSTLPDGYYATRNVLQILQCKKNKAINIDCPKGQIYVPGNEDKCTDAKKINEGNFCVNRTEGNWQDPFNCHLFYTCVGENVFSRKCSVFAELNYDPVNDTCEDPAIYPCKVVGTKFSKANVIEAANIVY